MGWIATIRLLGDIFNLRGFFVWHLLMAIIMCTVWVILFTLTALAFWQGKIFMAKDEDVIQDTIKAKDRTEDGDAFVEKRSEDHTLNNV